MAKDRSTCATPKRVRQTRNLRVRTLNAMTKNRSSRSGPLTLRFLTGLAHALVDKTPKIAHSHY
ncbi:hypothetical protein B9J76_07015 [Lacticaseibacillus paracasei]|nr:hypothetical protein LPEG9_02760 [Lacticaseibacillus paracasei]AYG22858.1 hypothetical protein CFM84_06755 [Lacticaseibacillus paracasei]KAB1968152.1 hypothetical protein F8272_01065 [Lacticaseibacillus paracasei]MCT3326765.1 hypothetical protein [Lacticaseibacillus paracasei]MCT3331954.1 hypothetical protein [Lacticaseibacillus paracasei]